jgi:hypothetical protein
MSPVAFSALGWPPVRPAKFFPKLIEGRYRGLSRSFKTSLNQDGHGGRTELVRQALLGCGLERFDAVCRCDRLPTLHSENSCGFCSSCPHTGK